MAGLVAASIAAVALAQSAGEPTITACVDRKGVPLRLLLSPLTPPCDDSKGETTISWNQIGPEGPTGPTGLPGVCEETCGSDRAVIPFTSGQPINLTVRPVIRSGSALGLASSQGTLVGSDSGTLIPIGDELLEEVIPVLSPGDVIIRRIHASMMIADAIPVDVDETIEIVAQLYASNDGAPFEPVPGAAAVIVNGPNFDDVATGTRYVYGYVHGSTAELSILVHSSSRLMLVYYAKGTMALSRVPPIAFGRATASVTVEMVH